MKILCSGSAGMVGSSVKEICDPMHSLILTDKHDMDVTDYNLVMTYGSLRPDLILHLAAETNLEYCKTHPAEAYLTNHTGTVHMMLLAKELDIPIVYISTAGIFNGLRKSYHEWDRPGALNHYGRSKWFGEIALADYPKTWIFRAGWMMGGGPEIDKKFVNIIYKKIKAGEKVIRAVNDVWGSPTYTHDLVATIMNAIDRQAPYGIYHCGGEGVATRCDVAEAIVEYLNIHDVDVVPVEEDYFNKEFHCVRSQSEVMENVKLNAMGLSKMRHWRVSLKEYIEKCYLTH